MATPPINGTGDDTGSGTIRVTAVLGTGGMATVWAGSQDYGDGWHRPCAVKMVRDDLQHDPDYRRRLRREAEIGLDATVGHPALLTTRGYASFAGARCVLVDLVDGPSLEDRTTGHSTRDRLSPRWSGDYLCLGSDATSFLRSHRATDHRGISPNRSSGILRFNSVRGSQISLQRRQRRAPSPARRRREYSCPGYARRGRRQSPAHPQGGTLSALLQRLALMTFLVAFSCGGSDGPPQSGRGWWCGFSVDNQAPSRCYRSYLTCGQSMVEILRSPRFKCEVQTQAYCLRYRNVYEGDIGWLCSANSSDCDDLQGEEIGEQDEVLRSCRGYE